MGVALTAGVAVVGEVRVEAGVVGGLGEAVGVDGCGCDGVDSSVGVGGGVVVVGVPVPVADSLVRPIVVVANCVGEDAESVVPSPVSALHPASRDNPAVRPPSKRRRDQRFVSSFRSHSSRSVPEELSAFSSIRCRCVADCISCYRENETDVSHRTTLLSSGTYCARFSSLVCKSVDQMLAAIEKE